MRFFPSALTGLALTLCCAVAAPAAQNAPTPPPASSPGCKLTVHVSGFRNVKGKLGVTLFTSADGWPEKNDKAYRHWQAPIDGTSATATAENLPPGDYAVAVLHDENENHKLDRNMIGWPKEGFGFANNPHVGLSAPDFKQALVHVTCPETETRITLIYK